MVRHYTVRENFKFLRRGDLQELAYDMSRDGCVLEYGRSQIDANREEIPELAEIVEVWEAGWSAGHISVRCNADATAGGTKVPPLRTAILRAGLKSRPYVPPILRAGLKSRPY